MTPLSYNNLSIYYQNARGLRSKCLDFYRNMSLSNHDIIVITETWLVDSISSSELFDDRYLVWRRDRDYLATGQTKGGGVLIAVRKDITVAPQPTFQSSAEDLWLTILLKDNLRNVTNLHICCVYIIDQALGLTFSQQLSNYLAKLSDNILNCPSDKFLILGDFNLTYIKWETTAYQYLLPTSQSNPDEQLFVDELNINGLHQYNYITNINNRILDLVLCNDSVSLTECLEPLVPIDPHHKPLSLSINFLQLPTLKPQSHLRYFYNKGDYAAINTKIKDVDWAAEFEGRSLEDAVAYFYDTVENLKITHIPSIVIYPNNYPIWYTPALKKMIKEKAKYLSKYNVYKNKSDLNSFKLLRGRVNSLEQTCYENYLSSVETNIEKCPKHFWSFVKNRQKSYGIPNTVNYQNASYNTGKEICDVFSNYFLSTFLTPSSNTYTGIGQNLNDTNIISDINKINVREDEVAKLLTNLDTSKSAGPDKLSPIFLTKCAKTIATPLSLLFNTSLSTCSFPSLWKSAFISPIHKKGPKQDVCNYRPISKLCVVAKIFEKVVYNNVYQAIQNSFSPSQHGFLKGRSTVSNLVVLNEYVTSSMDAGKQVDVVYTDYSKCFDRIDHQLLLRKLQLIGIRGDLLRWFRSYLDNRTQAVVISNYISSWVTIPSGVPQGSLLGPLLFLIFVNDIDECFHHSQLLCFADDMKIFLAIESSIDVMHLQSDLIRLDEYCIVNKLDLNPSKCSVTTFTRKRNIVPSSYTLKNQLLVNTNTTRDLGIVHDSKLLFDDHVTNIVTKASKALGFIMRISKNFNNAKTFKILYCTYVRSILEYASQIWNPSYDKYISRIERIQIKFLKYICFRLKVPYHDHSYDQLCKKFHFLPLSKRRDISDIIFLFKIASSNIDCPYLLSKLSLKVPTTTRSKTLLYIPTVGTNYRQNSYLLRVCNNYNSILKQTDLDIDLFCTSVATARRRLADVFFKS